MRITFPTTFLMLALCSISATQAVTIDTVLVGNAGNFPDSEIMNDLTSGYGAVGYEYRIGRTEATNAQYAEFLNAVAASDPYGLFKLSNLTSSVGGITRSGSPGSYSYSVKPSVVGQGPGGSYYTYGDKPVIFVSWYDVIRFANWLHNGQGNGDTETGAYTLGALASDGTPLDGGVSIVRNPGARWFLPSEDEWYKAAYHMNDGITANYWDFATSSNAIPDNNLPSADSGNSANYRGFPSDFTTGNPAYPLTPVGAYTLSVSPYGTKDQVGSVWEWIEDQHFNPFNRVVRGTSWNHFDLDGAAYRRYFDDAPDWNTFMGFRLASPASVVPEPGASSLTALAGLALLLLSYRRTRPLHHGFKRTCWFSIISPAKKRPRPTCYRTSASFLAIAATIQLTTTAFAQQTLTFQQGDGGAYSNTDATWIDGASGQGNINHGSDLILSVENDSTLTISRTLVRFPDIFGTAPGQIPPGATMISATLTLTTDNLIAGSESANAHSVHRVISAWNENTVTWNSFNSGGLSGVDYHATVLDTFVPGVINSSFVIDLTSALQAWSDNPGTNEGFIIINPSDDRSLFESEDSPDIAGRPKLAVMYVPEPSTASLICLFGLAVMGRHLKHRRRA